MTDVHSANLVIAYIGLLLLGAVVAYLGLARPRDP